MKTLKKIDIFISSPSDVDEEKRIALKVIEDLNSTPYISDKFALKALEYKTEVPPVVGITPQRTVDLYMMKADQANILICILWSRMGTPVFDDETNKKYQSGTEYEFITAYEANQKSGKPIILLYRGIKCLAEDSDLIQANLVKEFFNRFEGKDAKFKGLYNEYESNEEFEYVLRHDLDEIISTNFQQGRDGHASQSVFDEALIFSKKFRYSNERSKDLDIQQIIRDFGKSRFYFYFTMRPEFRRFASIRNYTMHNCWRFFFYSQKYSVTTGNTTVSPSQYRKLRTVSPIPPIDFSNGKKDFITKDGLEQTCIVCRGKGYNNCESCYGRRVVVCSDCNGNKYILEPLKPTENASNINKGTTTMHPTMVECRACNGKGIVKCSRCGGRGKESCDTCEGSGRTYSVELHRMEYCIKKETNTLHGEIPKYIVNKFNGKREKEETFIDPSPPSQKGISACRFEGFSISILLLDVYFEGRAYTIFYDVHNKKFQWNGYPVDYKKILTAASIIILFLFVIRYLILNARIFE